MKKTQKILALTGLILLVVLAAVWARRAKTDTTAKSGPGKEEAAKSPAVNAPDTESSMTADATSDAISVATAAMAPDESPGLSAGVSSDMPDNMTGDISDNPDAGTAPGSPDDTKKDDAPDEQTEEKEVTPVFEKQPLTDSVIERINGVSYHENDNITFDDLSYLTLTYVDFEGETKEGELICNKAIADDLLEIFEALFEAGYRIDKIRLVDEYGADDDASCADDNTSCFNYRVVEGTTRLSNHAKGRAIDINPFYNPYITYPDGKEKISPPGSEKYADRSVKGEHMIDEDDLCYKLFTEHGFTWGGHWKSVKDYQHFEKP